MCIIIKIQQFLDANLVCNTTSRNPSFAIPLHAATVRVCHESHNYVVRLRAGSWSIVVWSEHLTDINKKHVAKSPTIIISFILTCYRIDLCRLVCLYPNMFWSQSLPLKHEHLRNSRTTRCRRIELVRYLYRSVGTCFELAVLVTS